MIARFTRRWLTIRFHFTAVRLGAGFLACLPFSPADAAPAFPGAEGCGANATGGRGGSVYYVTNLNDSGAGSLRNGITSATGPRTILFQVSGTIDLLSELAINKPNLTIAGQTAPGDGITLKGNLTTIQNTHDVIVRYIRCRPGDGNCPSYQEDAFHFLRATNCIADHVTSSWSIDEALSCTWSTNVTVQWCIIGASLYDSCHVKGAHGYGSLLRYGAGRVSYHHNLYIHNSSRNPRPGDNIHLDFVNNVIYNWGGTAGYNAEDSADNPGGYTNALNYVGNYLVAGPSTSGHLTVAFDSGTATAANCEIYQSGNRIDSNKNGVLDGSDTGWAMFGSPYSQQLSPFPAPSVTTDSAPVAYERVLAFVGTSAARDAVDQLVVGHVRSQGGSIINSQAEQGGWPALNSAPAPLDTDLDGIPDYWEQALGWDPAVANNNHANSDGYTDLEWYLNWLAGPRAVCDRNGSVDANLQLAVGNSTNLVFNVANGTNGVANLSGDGHTAHFAAAADYTGLASFQFNATNLAHGVGFGPVTVNVLISTTNAVVPNSPPTLAAIGDRAIVAGATLVFTNSAADAESPPQTLTFALLGAPSGADVGAASGVFSWRPSIAQGGSSNYLAVVVTDNGAPNLGATQAFSVRVDVPENPLLQTPGFTNGQFCLAIDGVPGPDYLVQTSTNLVDWATLHTNLSPVPPFKWLDSDTNYPRRFYRIQLGP